MNSKLTIKKKLIDQKTLSVSLKSEKKGNNTRMIKEISGSLP